MEADLLLPGLDFDELSLQVPSELAEFLGCLGLAEDQLCTDGLHEYVQLSHRLAAELLDSGPRALHVVNAPSPAATASLAIGREVMQRIAGG